MQPQVRRGGDWQLRAGTLLYQRRRRQGEAANAQGGHAQPQGPKLAGRDGPEACGSSQRHLHETSDGFADPSRGIPRKLYGSPEGKAT